MAKNAIDKTVDVEVFSTLKISVGSVICETNFTDITTEGIII